MSWYRLDLGTADLAGAGCDAVRTAVDAAWHALGRPPACRVFTRHESEGWLHCHLMVYFSPGATALARGLGARACADPGAWDLTPLAGARPDEAMPGPGAGAGRA